MSDLSDLDDDNRAAIELERLEAASRGNIVGCVEHVGDVHVTPQARALAAFVGRRISEALDRFEAGLVLQPCGLSRSPSREGNRRLATYLEEPAPPVSPPGPTEDPRYSYIDKALHLAALEMGPNFRGAKGAELLAAARIELGALRDADIRAIRARGALHYELAAIRAHFADQNHQARAAAAYVVRRISEALDRDHPASPRSPTPPPTT